MTIAITPIYASILALFFVVLTFRVIGQRRIARISLGDGGNRRLLRRQRVHANFAEYVPLALVLMLAAEMQQTQQWFLNTIGLFLVVGRVVHAYAVSKEPEPSNIRAAGMFLTIVALVFGAAGNLILVLARLAPV
jgi:uncharacterized membrane protein YecN with MAPEG domain